MKISKITIPEDIIEYIRSRNLASPILIMLMLGFLYQLLANNVGEQVPVEYSQIMSYFIVLGLLLVFTKSPRWSLYLVIAVNLVIHVYFYTQIISKLDHDMFSTRDAAVEMTSEAFLQGKNPWSNVSELGVPATTGPASILFALPVVVLFGEINWLSFVFWIAFFVILLIGDLWEKNESFSVLVLLFVIDIFDFTHTLYWSLEELYYPFLFIALAYYLINCRKFVISGIFLAGAILFRLNYIFIVIGFLLWYYTQAQYSTKRLVQLGLGIAIGAIFILLPFILIGGKEFFTNNPITLSVSMSSSISWPQSNLIFRSLNFLGRNIGAEAMRFVKFGIIIVVMLMVTPLLSNQKHPFWHIAIGAFLAHTVGWFNPALPKDYGLIFVLPAFMAIAYSASYFPIHKNHGSENSLKEKAN